MTKTILITGASTGIGKATALLFQQQGWKVAATMRSPQNATDLQNLNNLSCLYLDVTKIDSIQQAIDQTIEQFGSIDVLVNNAGYGLIGPFEACTLEQIEKQFATNVFGLMDVTRAILPHFRQQKQGIVLNITSVAGRIAFPLLSLYHATKWSIEGLSESLQYELKPWNIQVKIIEPGPIKTDFYGRSAQMALGSGLTNYQSFIDKIMVTYKQLEDGGAPPEVVAKTIYRAATDNRRQLRYPVGGNAGFLLFLRKVLPDGAMRSIVSLLFHC